MHQANGNSYRESNRVLFQKADEYDGYLQIADWSSTRRAATSGSSTTGCTSRSTGCRRHDVHRQQRRRCARRTDVTPATPPWVTLETGDSGNTVAEVQEALLDAGDHRVGGADGVYGQQTAAAVSEFQEEQGLTVNGTSTPRRQRHSDFTNWPSRRSRPNRSRAGGDHSGRTRGGRRGAGGRASCSRGHEHRRRLGRFSIDRAARRDPRGAARTRRIQRAPSGATAGEPRTSAANGAGGPAPPAAGSAAASRRGAGAAWHAVAAQAAAPAGTARRAHSGE